MEEKNNLTIIVGHFGSGKTEFAANYALYLHKLGKNPVIADMDIVNPYFRIREQKEFFNSLGIKVISSNYEDDFHLDMPALAASLQTCFQSKEQVSIVDVGGDPSGANVLARYAKQIAGRTYSMWILVNANRPQTSTAEEAAKYIESIEHMSKLKVNGIISATHMLKETTIEDIRRGDDLVKRLSQLTGLSVIYTAVEAHLLDEAGELGVSGELFRITPLMRTNWL